MEVLIKQESPPTVTIKKTFIFLIFGLASLLGWNAITSELPFFTFYLEKMDPATSFPFLNYALNIDYSLKDVDDIRDKTKTLNIAASNKFKKDIKNL